MSHSRKRVGGRSSGNQDRGKLRSHAQSIIQNSEQSKGTVFSTPLGLGITIVVVLSLALMIVLGHATKTTSASGGSTSGVPSGYGSLNHPKGS